MNLNDHPGILGLTSRGVIAIHADWPSYPLEHGWESAVIALGSFPYGTQFSRIDDIDQCCLMLAEGYGGYRDPYDERAFHVAIWHEDLLEARELGLVNGIETLTLRQQVERYRERWREEIRKEYEKKGRALPSEDLLSRIGYMRDGEFFPIDLPPLDDFDGDDEEYDTPDYSWLGIDPSGKISLSSKGWERLERLWGEEFEVPERVHARIGPLVELGLWDTALREFGILIESKIRDVISSRLYGQKLIEEFIDHLDDSNRFLNSFLKIMRGELRTAFKFVRNEFAHNIVDLPRGRAYSLLGRMCHVLAEIETVSTVLDERESDEDISDDD